MKLDNFNKILIATAAINYMAHGIYETSGDIKKSGLSQETFHKEVVEEADEILHLAISQLEGLMDTLGDFINARDMVSPIDIRVTQAAFDIVCHGKDDSEEDYDEEG